MVIRPDDQDAIVLGEAPPLHLAAAGEVTILREENTHKINRTAQVRCVCRGVCVCGGGGGGGAGEVGHSPSVWNNHYTIQTSWLPGLTPTSVGKKRGRKEQIGM